MVAAALALVAAAFLLFRADVVGLMRPAMEALRKASPVVFFGAMAILPALGAPLAFFLLTAAPVFAGHLGMPAVLGLSIASITANMTLSYLLAARLLQPALQTLMTKWGHRLPQVRPGDVTDLIVLLRATPGVPFPVQNYLLGLAGLPFRRYLIVSCMITWPLGAAIILFGDNLWRGGASKITVGLLFLVALFAAVHLVRRHFEARQLAAGPVLETAPKPEAPAPSPAGEFDPPGRQGSGPP